MRWPPETQNTKFDISFVAAREAVFAVAPGETRAAADDLDVGKPLAKQRGDVPVLDTEYHQ